MSFSKFSSRARLGNIKNTRQFLQRSIFLKNRENSLVFGVPLEELTSELEDELCEIYIGQNIREEGVLQSLVDKEKATRLLGKGLIKEKVWYNHRLYLTTAEGDRLARRRLKEIMSQTLRRYILESSTSEIPRKIILFVVRRFVSEELTFPAVEPEFNEIYDSWTGKLLSDERIWTLCEKFVSALKIIGLCVKTNYYVSTGGGKVREPYYVISPEVRTFLLHKFRDPDFSSEEERSMKIFEILIRIKNIIGIRNLDFIRQRIYELLNLHDISENELASIVDGMSKLGITSKYRGLLSGKGPFEINDSVRFSIYLDSKLVRPAIELLLGRRQRIDVLTITRTLPNIQQVEVKLGALRYKERADFFLKLTDFEIQLREFIKSKLGEGWLTAIRNDLPRVAENWERKKKKDKRWGIDPERGLLNYADFSDYIQIFRKYKRVFFGNDEERGDVESHLRDWYNFGRNPLMHSRTVNREKYYTTLTAIKFIQSWTERRSESKKFRHTRAQKAT